MSLQEQDRLWTKLLQFVEAGRAVPIVGQELLTVPSQGGFVTLYRHLAEGLAASLAVDPSGLPDGAELNAVAQRYRAGGGSLEDVYFKLYQIARKSSEMPIPEPLLKLAEIEPLRLFVSTTFDSLLKRAIDEVRFGGIERTEVLAYSQQRVADLPARLHLNGPPQVFHLFGQLSAVRDEYAVTEEDTLEFVTLLQSGSHRPNNLFDELRRQPLFILGCIFPNWLARFFIRCARGERLSLTRGHSIVADRRACQDKVLLEFLKSYCKKTTVFPYGSALDFVDELHRRWKKRHPQSVSPRSAPYSRPEAGAVFLSYVREDRVVAMSISAALEKAGVDVWFDRNALKGNDDFTAVIEDSIKECSVFVPVLSVNTATRQPRFVKLEWNAALEAARQFNEIGELIVPVVIDDTSPSAQRREFRHLNLLSLPGGEPTSEFVGLIRDRFRAYHQDHQPAQ